MDNIIPPNSSKKKQGNIKKSKLGKITIGSLGKKVEIDARHIQEACEMATETAFSMGETSNKEEYRENMEAFMTKYLKEKQEKGG
jgi:hypothetical protein